VEVVDQVQSDAPEVITLDDNVEVSNVQVDHFSQIEVDPMTQGEVQLQDNTAIISMSEYLFFQRPCAPKFFEPSINPLNLKDCLKEFPL